MVFNWSLSDCKSLQISRTLFSILAGLNNELVSIVSILPLISFSSIIFSKPLGTILSAPITTGTTATLDSSTVF